MPFVRHEKCARCKSKKVVLKTRSYSALRRRYEESHIWFPACKGKGYRQVYVTNPALYVNEKRR